MKNANLNFEPAIYGMDESIMGEECTASYSNLIGFGMPQRPNSPEQIEQMVNLAKSIGTTVIWDGMRAKGGIGMYSVSPQDNVEGAVQRILGITMPSSPTPTPTPTVPYSPPRFGALGSMGAAIAAAQAAAAQAAAKAAAEAAAAKAAADKAAAQAAADAANKAAAEKAAADKAAAEAAASAAATAASAATAAQNAKTPEEAKAAENKATEAAATASTAAASTGGKKFLGMPMGVGIGVTVVGVAALGFVAWKLLKK